MSLKQSLSHWAMLVIGQRLRAITGSQSDLADFTMPLGDPGLFGPDSVTWKVHANFTAMMVGGLSSLMVQSLHPRALSAVWDHSDFRNKLKQRLGRTAYFVAATTYGSQALARRAIDRVNSIHANIRGTDLQGQPYTANEPDLIRWVHLAEVSAFLTAYQHLSPSKLSDRACDQYVREMSQIGHLLGAVDLPVTWSSTQEQLSSHLRVLRFDERAQEIFRLIENYPTDWLDKPFMQLTVKAALDVLPAWTRPLIDQQPRCALQVHMTKLALVAASEPIQWMLDQQGVRAVAHTRVRANSAPFEPAANFGLVFKKD